MGVAFKKIYLSEDTFTVTNLHSLGDGSFWQSAGLNNETEGAIGADVHVKLGTTTTAGDANGYANVHIARSAEEAADYAGEASGSEGSYAPNPSAREQSKNLRFIGRLAMKADETTARTYHAVIEVADLPPDFALIIENQSGAALASSGNEVTVRRWRMERIAT